MTTCVVLREVLDSDLSIFFDQQLDSTANCMVAFTQRDPTDRDAFSEHWKKIQSDGTVTIKTIVFDGDVAGNIMIFEHLGKPVVGYWLGKDYWSKGIATAALAQFLTEIKVRPLYAGVASDNQASIRVLEKCGFQIVGQQKSFAKARGEEIDEVIMQVV